ncbi:MAG TPA: sigma-70 family RNA polymerase sigma factor [Verrucomicrobiae bacterium]|nr:sigma-70 family RNA polymerase sigma factor [Verrucomicrobiae bacterium]
MASLNPTFVEIETPDTRSLLELARAGDAEAYGAVYHAYATRLLRQAVALCGNISQAEELAQDTLVEAWKCLHRYDGRCEFFTWLCAILLNRYHNSIRENRLLPFSALGNREQDEFNHIVEKLADRDSLPDETVQLHEQAVQVRACIQTLPIKHQQVIFLRFYVDDSLEGIAAALGCSVGTVKSRLFHALDKLRGMKTLDAEFANLKMKGSMS